MNEPSNPQNTLEPPSLPTGFNQNPSGVAKASFIIGIGSIVIWILALVSVMAFFVQSIGTAHKVENPGIVPLLAAGLLMLFSFLLNLIGLILGIIEVRKPIPNRWMAITGVAINGAVILFAIGLHLLGRGFLHHAP